MSMTEQQKQYIRDEYIKGDKFMKTVASELNISMSAVHGYIERCRASGELPKGRRKAKEKRVRREHGYIPKPKHIKGMEPGNTCVNCIPAVAKKCIYGAGESASYLCDYLTKTGELRVLKSPDPKKCTLFTRK